MQARVLTHTKRHRAGEIADVSAEDAARHPDVFKPLSVEEAEERAHIEAEARSAESAKYTDHQHRKEALRRQEAELQARIGEHLARQAAHQTELAEQVSAQAAMAAERAAATPVPEVPAPPVTPAPPAPEPAPPEQLPPHRRGRRAE